MREPANGMPDGTPEPTPQAFLHACQLPAAWAQQPQWRVLDTDFGQGLNFLATWLAWRSDPQRSHLLHYVATAPLPLFADAMCLPARSCPTLQSLSDELAAQCWGLLPGVHRLRFDGGLVLLTLLIGERTAMLRQQDMVADSIYLHSDETGNPSAEWSLHALKAIARSARRGTWLASSVDSPTLRKDLAQCGFQLPTPHIEPQAPPLLGTQFAPTWQPRKAPLWPLGDQAIATPPNNQAPRHAVVVGAGIAGAACAQQLALRGWQVTVLDAGAHPAAGASALPAGIFAPHTSSDDSQLSRITRAGLRTTVQWAQALLTSGQDWQMTGVLERRQLSTPSDETAAHPTEASPAAHERPASWSSALAKAAAPWSQPASVEILAAQGLPADDAALWHPHGGWLRPAALVQALLKHPCIQFIGSAQVAQIEPTSHTPHWQIYTADGTVLAQADLVVVCAGPQSLGLTAPVLPASLPLQPIRGQVSWGYYSGGQMPAAEHPVNGHGSWVPCFTAPNGVGAPAWVMGSSFERDISTLPPTAQEARAAHAANWAKLQTLLPATSQRYASGFAHAHSWAQVRCASPDRLPVVGPLMPLDHSAVTNDRLPLWVSTAMGSRGLTWALLCAELLVARLHAEPLPLPNNLAKALGSDRFI